MEFLNKQSPDILSRARIASRIIAHDLIKVCFLPAGARTSGRRNTLRCRRNGGVRGHRSVSVLHSRWVNGKRETKRPPRCQANVITVFTRVPCSRVPELFFAVLGEGATIQTFPRSRPFVFEGEEVDRQRRGRDSKPTTECLERKMNVEPNPDFTKTYVFPHPPGFQPSARQVCFI